jgi:uncharacterized protein
VQVFIALVAGIVFGSGLAISGMLDPARVRAFLDVGGQWDPTLAFVMGGAMLPMIVAWRLRPGLPSPRFGGVWHLPGTLGIDSNLILGAALFGVGWGIAGLCPGPAIANLAVAPGPAVTFVVALIAGMLLHAGVRQWRRSDTRN